MAGKEKEVVDVDLPILAAAVRAQGIGILKPSGIEFLDINHIVVLQEEAPIGFTPEEFEDRACRLGTVTIFRLHQKHRLAALQQFNRAVQDIQFVTFDVDLHERHVLIDYRIEPRDRDMGRHEP